MGLREKKLVPLIASCPRAKIQRLLLYNFEYSDTAPLISFAPHLILPSSFIGYKMNVGSNLLVELKVKLQNFSTHPLPS